MPLLALNFIIKTSFFCTIFLIFSAIVQDKRPFLFYYFWLYCGSDSGTSICWLQICIKILFLQCNLTWKTEQLTNYKCSLIQYGDEHILSKTFEIYVKNVFLITCITIYSLLFEKKPSSEPCLHLFLLGAAIVCLTRVLLCRRNVYNFVKRHSELIAIFLKKNRKKTRICK